MYLCEVFSHAYVSQVPQKENTSPWFSPLNLYSADPKPWFSPINTYSADTRSGVLSSLCTLQILGPGFPPGYVLYRHLAIFSF